MKGSEKSAEVVGLEKTITSIRTQMRLQREEALRLARAVVSEFCAGQAYELANELLATE